ncbi:hypothetical protein U9M48_022204 [Paspalum notatum var. saurae]|uniref:Uncharacterized protein n=1 Tax=Paspalum notatum var. saurae TaxID=547442 RepID=A0AAQ3WUT2_PASNO
MEHGGGETSAAGKLKREGEGENYMELACPRVSQIEVSTRCPFGTSRWHPHFLRNKVSISISLPKTKYGQLSEEILKGLRTSI